MKLTCIATVIALVAFSTSVNAQVTKVKKIKGSRHALQQPPPPPPPVLVLHKAKGEKLNAVPPAPPAPAVPAIAEIKPPPPPPVPAVIQKDEVIAPIAPLPPVKNEN